VATRPITSSEGESERADERTIALQEKRTVGEDVRANREQRGVKGRQAPFIREKGHVCWVVSAGKSGVFTGAATSRKGIYHSFGGGQGPKG